MSVLLLTSFTSLKVVGGECRVGELQKFINVHYFVELCREM